MNTDTLLMTIENRLKRNHLMKSDSFNKGGDMSLISSVLLLISDRNDTTGKPIAPYLVLNKRSKRVKQAGDLCCPGGGISPMLDASIAGILNLPFSPLYQWAYWRHLKKTDKTDARNLSLLAATGLREGFEEMRLNPLGVKFVGRLPVQQLMMFKRDIHPLVGWIKHQIRFVPNREVDKIVRIPIHELLLPENYACYCLSFGEAISKERRTDKTNLPCFLHRDGKSTELLWGATYRIVVNFLDLVFDFTPPPLKTLTKVYGHLDGQYLTGHKKQYM